MNPSSVRNTLTNKPYQRPVTDLIRRARKGVLRQQVDEIAQLVGLTDKEMAHILNMSVRGLHGKSTDEQLTLAASERLLLLERLIQHGLAVFDGRADQLSSWLHTPLAELGYRDYTDEAGEPTGPASVRDMGSFTKSAVVEQNSTQQNTANLSPVVPQSPLAVLDTVSGFSLAEDVLGRIEWGLVG